MIDLLVEFFRASYSSLYIATFIVAAFLFLSGLDDVFIDMYYWLHHIFMRKMKHIVETIVTDDEMANLLSMLSM